MRPQDIPMLHPQTQALLEAIQQAGQPALHTLTPAQARQAYRERARLTQPSPPPARVQTLQADGPAGPIALRSYRPPDSQASDALPALVYLHGGGWVIGDLDTHDTLCRQLAQASGCAVLSVDYRLAPEHPFPAAFDDALAATRWVARHGARWHIDPTRLAVGGDSAGANLAAAVALAWRDTLAAQALPPLAFQLLIYPVSDLRCSHDSYRRNGQGYVLTAQTMHWFIRQYLGPNPEPALLDDWRASPLHAPQLGGLPPALVLTAGFDPLADEGLAYAQALSRAGTPASHVCFERQIHGFALMSGVLHEAHTAVALCAGELRRHLLA